MRRILIQNMEYVMLIFQCFSFIWKMDKIEKKKFTPLYPGLHTSTFLAREKKGAKDAKKGESEPPAPRPRESFSKE